MTEKALQAGMPADLATMVECGYAIWATDTVDETLRARAMLTELAGTVGTLPRQRIH